MTPQSAARALSVPEGEWIVGDKLTCLRTLCSWGVGAIDAQGDDRLCCVGMSKPTWLE